ncbi:hypothetical protein F5X99DRAFT_394937 [Biscogniauxia marginata]|nr:hypothetical protein F5X99DRAFT_394937 [Biscogniauxia marginata]
MAIDGPAFTHRRLRVALTLGDPAGIGPELAAKLVSNPENLKKADIFIFADKDEMEAASIPVAGLRVPIAEIASANGVQIMDEGLGASKPVIPPAQVSKEAGERSMHQLRRALNMVLEGKIDAIVFTPLNKSSLKLAGMEEEDELRWFAKYLDYKGTTSEINIIDGLWTGRVTSHVGVEKVAGMVTKETVKNAIVLLDRLLWESGIESPRLAVCALNPHNGEKGSFGRQEIEHIVPGIEAAREMGYINVEGSYPSDTIFLRRAHYDGIVTMYHDQGQIAMKLLGFDGGITVQGGLPVVITTPAHGTAFDIVGKGIANVRSTQKAFDIAVAMAERRLISKGAETKERRVVHPAASQQMGASCC